MLQTGMPEIPGTSGNICRGNATQRASALTSPRAHHQQCLIPNAAGCTTLSQAEPLQRRPNKYATLISKSMVNWCARSQLAGPCTGRQISGQADCDQKGWRQSKHAYTHGDSRVEHKAFTGGTHYLCWNRGMGAAASQVPY